MVRIKVGRGEIRLFPSVARMDQLTVVGILAREEVELNVRIGALAIHHPNTFAQHNVVLVPGDDRDWAAIHYRYKVAEDD